MYFLASWSVGHIYREPYKGRTQMELPPLLRPPAMPCVGEWQAGSFLGTRNE